MPVSVSKYIRNINISIALTMIYQYEFKMDYVGSRWLYFVDILL